MRKRGVRPQYCGRTAPGREDRLREIVRRELAPLTDEMRVDALGNLIAVKKASTSR